VLPLEGLAVVVVVVAEVVGELWAKQAAADEQVIAKTERIRIFMGGA